MEETEIKDINDFCFRIFFDFQLVDFNKILDSLEKYGDFIIYNNCIYIWLSKKDNKRPFLKFMSKVSSTIKPSVLYVTPLLLIDIQGRNDFLEVFVNEHFSSVQIAYLQEKKQEDLIVMLNNIKRANEELDKMIELEKQKKEGLRNA